MVETICGVQAQIGGHSVDMPVSNPYLTDKIIDEEMTPLLDLQISDKRKWLWHHL